MTENDAAGRKKRRAQRRKRLLTAKNGVLIASENKLEMALKPFGYIRNAISNRGITRAMPFKIVQQRCPAKHAGFGRMQPKLSLGHLFIARTQCSILDLAFFLSQTTLGVPVNPKNWKFSGKRARRRVTVHVGRKETRNSR
jgi:hypothetical protein